MTDEALELSNLTRDLLDVVLDISRDGDGLDPRAYEVLVKHGLVEDGAEDEEPVTFTERGRRLLGRTP